MKVYVINLDKNVERMGNMSLQLRRLGVDFERIPAVYGASLTKEERKGCFAPFRSFCAMGYKLLVGEIGCALSHCKVYKRMIDNKIGAALVLEDDVVINDLMLTVITNVERFMDAAKAQVFLLSSFGIEEKKVSGIERIKGGMCTDGYVITLPAAKIILRANYPVLTVSDGWARWERQYGVEMYRAWPTVVRQDNNMYGSDINMHLGDIEFNKHAHMCAMLMRPIRAIGKVIDAMMFFVTGR